MKVVRMTGHVHCRRQGRVQELILTLDRDVHYKGVVRKLYDPEFKAHNLTLKVVVEVVE